MNSDQDKAPLGPPRPDPDAGQPGQPATTPPEAPRRLEVVTVKVFDRACSFKSNRPELVQEIASLAEEEIALVRGQFPELRNEMDLAAHVAFRLSRRLMKCLQVIGELNSTLDQAECRVERMAISIDRSLEE